MNYPDEISRLKSTYTERDRSPEILELWQPFNPVSQYYRQTQEREFVIMVRKLGINIQNAKILDVGCGFGSLMRFLYTLGTPGDQLFGFDLMELRVDKAKTGSPASVTIMAGDAQNIPFPNQSFDLVTQFTLFSSIFEPGLRVKIAAEIERVLRPGGFLVWYDMSKIQSIHTRCISYSEIIQLFPNLTPIYTKKLHNIKASYFARKSFLLCEIFDSFPLINKSHVLCALQKNVV